LIHLTLAISPYDHVRDLACGEVRAEGIELTSLNLGIEEIFHRFLKYREWDVSELSFAKYVAMRSQGDHSVLAIPVFPSRVFRHSAVFVRSGSPLREMTDLAGKRVGIPEWSQTAGVYMRGLLAHQYGVQLEGIDWWQAGVNEPGREEKVELQLADGIRLTRLKDRTLNEMLLAGELDAVMSAHPPQAFKEGSPEVRRLLEDPDAVEEDYFRETGIWPIMHIVAIRKEILDRYPWVAMNLFKAFEAAKDRSLQRLNESTASRFPLPWQGVYSERARELFGEDQFPYGIEANRPSIEALLEYCHEQRVAQRHLTAEEIFPASVQTRVKV
jgi:4,5-dihydroxyphthalate decarboxylase